MPNVHIAIGNLKSWLIGTHKGVWPRHLKAHLDEFVFRYNRRHNLGLAFRTLLGLGASRGPTPHRVIRGAQDMPKITYTPSRRQTQAAKPKRRPAKTNVRPRGATTPGTRLTTKRDVAMV